ncbi:histidine phosphatase family protein [Nonomuraea sp. NPDC059194]|uniref:histidine phosphatase family protein n=1 Tax=Nonomuraea sp. NPDC059194 TaxID=3346764 RepID=UPI00368B0C47
MLFVRHALTAGMRGARFPTGEERADPSSLDKARRLAPMFTAGTVFAGRAAFAAPGPAAWETAVALGFEPVVVPELAEPDHGRWRGLPYEEVAQADPESFARWLTDPGAAPHGGESHADAAARVVGWLETLRDAPRQDDHPHDPSPAASDPSPASSGRGPAVSGRGSAASDQSSVAAGPRPAGGAPGISRAGGSPERIVVVCDVGVVRAVLGHALGTDPLVAARFDLAPLSLTQVSAAREGWRIGYVNRKASP